MTADDLRHRAPLLDAWASYRETDPAPFIIPGHKGNGGSISPILGDVLSSDVPFYGGLEGVRIRSGVLDRAEQLAAELWGADWCRFSTGGSTHANQVLALAIGRPGDKVLVARNSHRSVLLGLVFAGLHPVWLPAEVDPAIGLPTGLSLAALDEAIAEHPDAVAVWCVEPGYVGTLSDLPAVIARAHAAGMAALVDQAWAAHFGFHPGYPAHALALGADAMVTSAHKTLPAFSQAALVLARTERLDRGRLERAYEAAATTSPAGAVLASTDGARAVLGSPYGVERLGRMLDLVVGLRAELSGIGLETLDPDSFAPGRFDPAKVVVLLANAGLDGIELERRLLADGVTFEMVDRDLLVPIVSLVDDESAAERLVRALAAATAGRGEPRPVRAAPQWGHMAPQALTPREAFFADHERVPADEALGRVSVELIAPYPPGIPVVAPGEVLTAESLDALATARDSGARIAYADDPTLATYLVTTTPRA